MNKITFKDVAHMYLGCKIQTAEGIGTFNELAVDDEPIHEPITSYDLVNAHLSFDEVKPVLRSLEYLTDDDAINLVKKYPNLPDFNLDIAEATPTEVAMTIMILCREGVDCFNLIDNGEAIDAATLGEEAGV